MLKAAGFFILLLSSIIYYPSSSQAQDITTGLVGHWKFDDGTGSATAADSSGNGNTGSLTNMDANADWVEGKIGGAIKFTDSSDRVIVPHSASIDLNDTVSVAFWIKADVPQSAWASFLCKDPSHAGYGYGFGIAGTGDPNKQLHTRVDTSVQLNRIAQVSNFFNNEWRHAVVIFDNGTRQIYVDGSLVFNGTYSHGTGLSNTTDLHIGNRCAGENVSVRGYMDDVRLYNRRLTAADVAALYTTAPGPLPCNADYEAVMIYNDAQNILQYCDGTNWIDMGPEDASMSPPTDGLVGHWKLNDATGTTATDSSGNGNDGTLTNMDTATDWITGKDGGGLDFDGTDDRVVIPDSTDFDFGTGDFTIAAWIYWPNTQGARFILANSTGVGAGFRFGVSNSKPYCFLSDGTHFETSFGSSVFTTNTWQHLVIVYDRDVGCIAYVDGTYHATHAGITAKSGNVNNSNNIIMAPHYDAGEPDLDDVRIYNRALSATEITTLFEATGGTLDQSGCTAPAGEEGEVDYNYTQGVMQYCNGANWVAMGPIIEGGSPADEIPGEIDAPTDGMIAHYKLDETSGSNIADSTGNTGNGTWYDFVNDDVTEETVSGKDGTALSFDGANDYIDIPDTLPGGADPRTFAFWAYPNNTTVMYPFQYGSGSGGGRLFSARINADAVGALSVGFTNHRSVTNAGDVPAGQWTHVAIVVPTGATDTGDLLYYINGSEVSSGDAAGVPVALDTAQENAEIGLNPGNTMDGYLDDFRVYNRGLSAAEVAQLYNATKGGLVGHWKFDESGDTNIAVDSSVNGNDGTLTNFPADESANWVSGANGNALNFDGTNDFINVGNHPEYDLSTYTLSAWVNFPASTTTGSHRIMAKRDTISGNWMNMNFGFLVYGANGTVEIGHVDSSNSFTTAVSTTDIRGQGWVHLTAVYDGTDLIVYYNGTEEDRVAHNAPKLTGTQPLYIGETPYNGGGGPFEGQIDDVRIYNTALSASEVQALYEGTGGGEYDACVGSPSPGDVCLDGTVYAGVSPDGSVAMFTTPCDYGQSWDGSSCTGSADTSITWSSGNSNSSSWVITGITNTTTGAANTAALINIDADSLTAGFQNHEAAHTCNDLVYGGHSDWYLGSSGEVSLLYTNRVAIGNFSDTGQYFTSREWDNRNAVFRYFIDGSTPASAKHFAGRHLRCVRKGTPGTTNPGACSSPDGVSGELVYNDTQNIMQYCNGSEWVGVR